MSVCVSVRIRRVFECESTNMCVCECVSVHGCERVRMCVRVCQCESVRTCVLLCERECARECESVRVYV